MIKDACFLFRTGIRLDGFGDFTGIFRHHGLGIDNWPSVIFCPFCARERSDYGVVKSHPFQEKIILNGKNLNTLNGGAL